MYNRCFRDRNTKKFEWKNRCTIRVNFSDNLAELEIFYFGSYLVNLTDYILQMSKVAIGSFVELYLGSDLSGPKASQLDQVT